MPKLEIIKMKQMLFRKFLTKLTKSFEPISKIISTLLFILVLLGASVGGILGMLFAVPIAAILKVVLNELDASIKK